jgi:hypothetical protein
MWIRQPGLQVEHIVIAGLNMCYKMKVMHFESTASTFLETEHDQAKCLPLASLWASK